MWVPGDPDHSVACPSPKLERALWVIVPPAAGVLPVDRSCEESKSQELAQNDQGRTIRSALISLPSVVLVVVQELSDEMIGGRKTKEDRRGGRGEE